MTTFLEPISENVWNIKYRYTHNQQIIDQSIEATWQRVAHAIAKAEARSARKFWQQQFYQLLEDFNFLPGGRILAGAGTARKVTLFNCFVMNIREDSLAAIFDALKEGATTLQQGGGIGYDFSILRPQGQLTDQTGSIASGPVSFMKIWDSMSATMQSSGARRGAMMGTLRCDHPDIEEFIAAKSDPQLLRQFNVSVLVTDEFMRAVQNNSDWALVFPVKGDVMRYVKARELWEKIIKAAYQYAEPGVIFVDTINRYNPLWYCEQISASNPCGEIPLPPYGSCNLGSINLTQLIQNPFSNQANIDWQKLIHVTELATRFLDNVITISRFPLKAQQQVAHNTRRMGLGFTGLADALIMLGMRYGSAASLQLAQKIMQTIANATWQTSIDLAKERGSFPLLNKKLYLQGEYVRHLPAEIRQQISRYGMRNSHHNAIAPAGTISLLANNISNGLEPVFAPHYVRRVRTVEGKLLTFNVMDYAYRIWQSKKSANNSLPPAWSDAQTLSPKAHLQIQAAVQPFIDNAISKTINLPQNFPFAKLTQVYGDAYKAGLKGCTIFRPNPVTGSVLSIGDVDRCCTK